MTDEDFRKLCNVYGFAPSRALRELIDAVLLEEHRAVVRMTNEMFGAERGRNNLFSEGYDYALEQVGQFVRGRGGE